VALITLLADVITSYFYYKNYNRKYGRVKLHLDIKRWLEMGKVSSQLFVSSALFVIYMNFGTIALGFMKNENAVGIYGAAAKLTFFIYALSDLFVAATFPVVSRLYHESKEKLGEFMRYCLKITVLLGLPVAIGGTILGPKIIALVYGVSYVQSGGVFQILSWFAAINLTSFVLSYSLVACDRQHTYMKVMVAGVIANVVFNIIAIPMAGYYASAAALVITESVTLLLSSLLVRRFVKLPSLGSYTRLVAAVFVMAGTLLLLQKLNVVALAVISVGAYFGASVVFGGITRSDINRLREVFA
jgi:O-antigen/teichoic acid export membrane protein